MRLIGVVRCLFLFALTSVSPTSSFADSIVQVQVGWMFQDRGGLCLLANRPGLNENCILSTSIWNIVPAFLIGRRIRCGVRDVPIPDLIWHQQRHKLICSACC